jgi:hypothetical protein
LAHNNIAQITIGEANMAADKQRRAFISYSRTNKEFAIKLTKGLRSAGYPVWFDLMDIPTGSRWDDEVEKALRECSIFMIILTPASIASNNVKDEIGYAIDHGKRILPVLLENCDVPLRLRRFQYVDFTSKSFEEGFESARELLGDIVDEASVPLQAKSPDDTQIERNAERKERQEADQLASQKAESESKAEAERLAQARAESERKAKQEDDRLAVQKVEREAKVKASPVQVKPETVSTEIIQKRPISKGLIIGIVGVVAVVILCIAGIGYIISNGIGTPATEAPVVEVLPANALEPTSAPDTQTPEPSATPTFAPPVTPYVRILGITVDAEQRYVVEYETFGYTEERGGMHVHFFFDTVLPEQADAGLRPVDCVLWSAAIY